ncbi:glutamate dehydrogenase (NADP(+)) gdh1 [Ancistrocladus abbreviatus]
MIVSLNWAYNRIILERCVCRAARNRQVSISRGSFGAVESVKAINDVNSPIFGEIIEVNSKLTTSLGLINSSPYVEGWMIKVKPRSTSELESLMGPKEYTNFDEEEDAAH